MLLTKECDYGVRIIRALAVGERRTVKYMCDTEHIPSQYAYKIVKKLERAGLVQSLRGRHGGYQLIKPLNSFSLYDVVIAIDENLFIFECLREDKFCTFKNLEQTCTVHLEFERLQKLLIDEMCLKTMGEILLSKSDWNSA